MSTQSQQAATLATATRTGTHWTQSELDRVRTAAVPSVQLAKQLGRTLYSIYSARRVKLELAERAPVRKTRELPYDRGFTSVEHLFLGD